MKNYILLILSLIIFLIQANCSSPGKADNGLGEEKASQKSITSFAFLKSRNSQLSDDYFASINELTGDIVLTIRQNTLVDTAELIATYTFSGSYVVLDSVVQQSGVTSNDFRKCKRYRIFSENGKYKDYNVTISFILSYPYKPEAYDVGIVGDLAVGKTIGAAYTFIDRNGEKETESVIKWYIESPPYSDNYALFKTQTVTPSSSSNKLSDAKIEIPSGKENCKIRISVTPKSNAENDDSAIGYEVSKTSLSCIKPGFSGSMIIINEVCTFSSLDPRDEYICLYNSSINDANLSGFKLEYYDMDDSTWKLFCDFDDSTKFFKPEKATYPALNLFEVSTEISAKGYYLVSRQETDKSTKRLSDIVLKKNNAINLSSESGSIRLVNKSNMQVVDLFAYGMTEEYEGPKVIGTSLSVHANGEILKRLNNIDSDVSAKDIKSRPKLTPLSSGRNAIDLSYGPLIIGRIKAAATKPAEDGNFDEVSTTYWLGGTADDEDDYSFHDWLYGGESDTEFNWILYYINSSGKEVILNDSYPEGTPEDKIFSANSKGKNFEINKRDYELLPIGYPVKVRLEVTPVSINPSNGQNVRGNKVVYDYDNPVTLFIPAKAKITKFKPSNNLVEIFLERGGTLHNLYIGHAYPCPNDMEDPEFTEPEYLLFQDAIIDSVTTSTYPTSKLITICFNGTDPNADINLPVNINFSYFSLRGGDLEIKELRKIIIDEDGEKRPEFDYQDILVYGMGNHISQKSLALKKYLVNLNSLFRGNYDNTIGLGKFNYQNGLWKLQDGIKAFEAFPPNLSADPYYNPVNEAIEDMTDDDYKNALNTDTDYIKIPADINSYIIYREYGEDVVVQKTDPADSSIDYYISTPLYEYVYEGSYHSIQLNNHKTMIGPDLEPLIPLFLSPNKYLYDYTVYLKDTPNVVTENVDTNALELSSPFPDPNISNVFSYNGLPLCLIRVHIFQSSGLWKQVLKSSHSAYSLEGPVTSPNFAEQYPIPKFRDYVIRRKVSSTTFYTDTNTPNDFTMDTLEW